MQSLNKDDMARLGTESRIIKNTYNCMVDRGEITRSVDLIAYTEDFNRLYKKVCEQIPYAISKHDVFRRLMNCRKRGACRAP